jgi:CMP-2-keto-3-deoxyoctulosonic acid synthetase
MKTTYNLEKEGMKFKADFNFNYDIVCHIFEIRTKKGYLRTDFIKDKKTKKLYFSRRTVDFTKNKAVFEKKEIKTNLLKNY